MCQSFCPIGMLSGRNPYIPVACQVIYVPLVTYVALEAEAGMHKRSWSVLRAGSSQCRRSDAQGGYPTTAWGRQEIRPVY